MPHLDFDVIIIGAGVGGLTCGTLLAQRGLKVLVLEKNRNVGGCCTSFRRRGFAFDVSVQSIGECQRAGRIWRLLDRLNLLDKIQFIRLEPAREYHFPDRKIRQYSDLNSHIDHLSSQFPEESKGIREVYSTFDHLFREMSGMPPSLDWFDTKAFRSRYPLYSRWKDKTLQDLLDQYIVDPRLKTILSVRSSYALMPPQWISVVAMSSLEMSYFEGGVYCVKGNVETFPRLLMEKVIQLGSQVMTKQEVTRILIEDKRAIGIRTREGAEYTGRAIVSNCDATMTFCGLVEKGVISPRFLSRLQRMKPSLSYYISYLGIDGSLDQEIPCANNEIFHDYDPLKEYDALSKNQLPQNASYYLLAPSLVSPDHAPKGMSTLCLSFKIPYAYSRTWNDNVRRNLSQRLLEKASGMIPNLRDRILVMEDSTPVTIERMTNNRSGSAYGWAQYPRQAGIYRLNRATPLKNLYLTGHWTSPGGGISAVVASGEITADLIWDRLS
ncbi:MAG: NAD(P)/FAD-dependent oxidoreductase [Deltaproteobacteria bacterium]|nr:NAD(P)/FAD-dependent oxidoreductase [Deltaproteobacteria bacterium]